MKKEMKVKEEGAENSPCQTRGVLRSEDRCSRHTLGCMLSAPEVRERGEEEGTGTEGGERAGRKPLMHQQRSAEASRVLGDEC